VWHCGWHFGGSKSIALSDCISEVAYVECQSPQRDALFASYKPLMLLPSQALAAGKKRPLESEPYQPAPCAQALSGALEGQNGVRPSTWPYNIRRTLICHAMK